VKILLDTNIALAIGNGSEPLGVTELVENQENECFLSVVNLWEIVIKTGIGKLDIGMGIKEFSEGFTDRGYSVLNVQEKHVFALSTLPPVHKDPFDRLLVAQARQEGMQLLTTDLALAEYGPNIMHITR